MSVIRKDLEQLGITLGEDIRDAIQSALVKKRLVGSDGSFRPPFNIGTRDRLFRNIVAGITGSLNNSGFPVPPPSGRLDVDKTARSIASGTGDAKVTLTNSRRRMIVKFDGADPVIKRITMRLESPGRPRLSLRERQDSIVANTFPNTRITSVRFDPEIPPSKTDKKM